MADDLQVNRGQLRSACRPVREERLASRVRRAVCRARAARSRPARSGRRRRNGIRRACHCASRRPSRPRARRRCVGGHARRASFRGYRRGSISSRRATGRRHSPRGHSPPHPSTPCCARQRFSTCRRRMRCASGIAFSSHMASSASRPCAPIRRLAGRMFRDCATSFGLTLEDPSAVLGSEERCRNALHAAGFSDITVSPGEIHLSPADLEAAWESNLRSAAHAPVRGLPIEDQDLFRSRYEAMLKRALIEDERAVTRGRRSLRLRPQVSEIPTGSSHLQQVLADDDAAPVVDASRVEPHLVGDLGIVGRHEMRQHQELDAGSLRDAAGVLG